MVGRIAPYGIWVCVMSRVWRNGGAYCALRGAGPVGWVDSFFDESMKAGVGPVGESLHMTVFYRIDVYVVDVPGEILFVTNEMIPKSTLPDSTLATAKSYLGSMFTMFNSLGEPGLD